MTKELKIMPKKPKMNNLECYDKRFIDGLRAYAHWQYGEEYVGTTGRTLKDAINKFKLTWNYKPPEEDR